MKKAILSILTLATLTISCRSENDEVAQTSKIIGKWNFSKIVIKSGKNTSDTLATENFTDCQKKSTAEFTSDKFTEIVYNIVSGNCKLISNETTNYTIEDNNLKFDGETSKIISLTNNELILQDDDGYDYNNDGTKDLFWLYLNK